MRLFRSTRSNTKTMSPVMLSPILTPDTPHDNSFNKSMFLEAPMEEVHSIADTFKSLEVSLEKLAKRWLTPQADLDAMEK